jgi:RNA polymerase sigma-70 factor (ECF subfamily)
MHESDVQWIERLRASDVEAFRVLFEKYQPILFRNVFYSQRDENAAHDIVQETFLRIWEHRASLRPDLSFLAYALRISRNLVMDDAKRRMVREKLKAEVPAPSASEGEDPDGSVQVRMLEDRVSEIVRTKLAPKCREIFLLSRIEGMSHAEISAHLGVSTKTVENQITRALKVLRRFLRGYTSEYL